MKKTGEITELEWFESKNTLLGRIYYPNRLSPVEQVVYRPVRNLNTDCIELHYDEQFKDIPVWQIAMGLAKVPKKKKK